MATGCWLLLLVPMMAEVVDAKPATTEGNFSMSVKCDCYLCTYQYLNSTLQ